MKRFFVCRAYVKWKGKMYYKGDLLPENFTHHDKARSIYNSRIGKYEITEEEISVKITSPDISTQSEEKPGDVSPATSKPSKKGISGADKKSFNFPLTGTSQQQ